MTWVEKAPAGTELGKCGCGTLIVSGGFCRECGAWGCGCGKIHPEKEPACPDLDEPVILAGS